MDTCSNCRSLREWTIDVMGDPNSYCGLDMLGGCSDEDIELSMKYYASEAERARWLESFPDYRMPPHEDPPYDRDRFLPRAGWPWDGPHPDAAELGNDPENS